MKQLFQTSVRIVAGITLVAAGFSADAAGFSEDFESGLGQWTGKHDGSHSGITVGDPLSSGRGNVLKWMKESATTNSADFIGQIGFPSTRAYVEAVVERRQRYAEEFRAGKEKAAVSPP